MIRLAAVAVISFASNVVALIVAGALLDDMAADATGVVVGAVVFTIATVLFEPLIRQVALRNKQALLGSSALIATLAGLIVAVILTDGLAIRGLVTWVLATVIVWAIALAARVLLPLVIFKKVLAERNAG
jgi:putative membrane protein